MTLSNYINNLQTWSEAKLQQNPVFLTSSPFYNSIQLNRALQTDVALLIHTLTSLDASKIHLCAEDWKHEYDKLAYFLTALCFYKYAHNQTLTTVEKLYQTGTVLFNPRREEARVVIGRRATGMVTRPVRQKDGDVLSPSFEQLAKYIPLAGVTEFSYNRNSLENLVGYFNLFAQTVQNFRALTEFPSRLLVVTSHKTILQLSTDSHLPIRYQFERYYNIPLVTPLVEIVNRYEDAREHLRLDRGLDEVVILGDLGYKNDLNDILNDLGDGYFKRLIVIGSYPIHYDYNFCCWPWSHTERALLRTEQLHDCEHIIISDSRLNTYKSLLSTTAQQLGTIGLPLQQAEGALSRMFSQYIRDAWIDVSHLLDYHRELLEEPESEWREWFSLAGQATAYSSFCQQLIQLLSEIAGYIQQHRYKLTRIKELGSLGIQTWVVARPKQVKALNEHFSDESNIRAITYQELKKHLRVSSDGRTEQFIFPCLHLNYAPQGEMLRDYHLYIKALERGKGYLLLYEGIEEDMVNLCQWLYQRAENHCLTYPDRNLWANIIYQPVSKSYYSPSSSRGATQAIPTHEVEVIEKLLRQLELVPTNGNEQSLRAATADHQSGWLLEKLNDYFAKYFGVWKDMKRSHRLGKTFSKAEDYDGLACLPSVSPTRDTRFRFFLDNGVTYECNSRVYMAKVQHNRVVAVHPTDLHTHDTIVHFDITFDNCFDALSSLPEAREALNEVKWAIRTWREWLAKSIEIEQQVRKCDFQNAKIYRYRKVVQLVKASDPEDQFVEFSRFEGWIKPSSTSRFPRKINHLEAILNSHLNQVHPKDKAVKEKEMQRILSARDQSASFREVTTKLNVELSTYLISDRKGQLLSGITTMHLEDLLKTRKDLIINRIEQI